MTRPAQFFKANPSLTWWATTAAESAYVSTTWTVPPSGEMYHSYARVPGSLLVPETISSISSLNVSSLPALSVTAFTQETCPSIESSLARRFVNGCRRLRFEKTLDEGERGVGDFAPA